MLAFALSARGSEARAQDAGADAGGVDVPVGEPELPQPGAHDVAIQTRALTVRSVVSSAIGREWSLRLLPYADQTDAAEIEVINRGSATAYIDEVEVHTQREGTNARGPSARWSRQETRHGGDFEITVPESITAGQRTWVRIRVGPDAPREPGHFLGDVSVRMRDQVVPTRLSINVFARNGALGALFAFVFGILVGKGAALWKLTPPTVGGAAKVKAFVTGATDGGWGRGLTIVFLSMIAAALEFDLLYITNGATFGAQRWPDYLAMIAAGITFGAAQHVTARPKVT